MPTLDDIRNRFSKESPAKEVEPESEDKWQRVTVTETTDASGKTTSSVTIEDLPPKAEDDDARAATRRAVSDARREGKTVIPVSRKRSKAQPKDTAGFLRIHAQDKCLCTHRGADHCADGSCGVCGCLEYRLVIDPPKKMSRMR